MKFETHDEQGEAGGLPYSQGRTFIRIPIAFQNEFRAEVCK